MLFVIMLLGQDSYAYYYAKLFATRKLFASLDVNVKRIFYFASDT